MRRDLMRFSLQFRRDGCAVSLAAILVGLCGAASTGPPASAAERQSTRPARVGKTYRPARTDVPSIRGTPLHVTLDAIPIFDAINGPSKNDENAPTASGGIAGAGCGEVTHANPANFNGGQFAIQAGFTEGEVAYAEFDVAPDQFPIRLDKVEIIVAQENSPVQTVTEWSLLIWDGPPVTFVGLPVATFSTSEQVLQPIRLQPSTQAVNVTVIIDPNDPEPVFLNNDSGQNSFTVGFRIDEHNVRPPFPCLFLPDPNRNAFPTTDTDGVDAPDNNWLAALTCGNVCDGTHNFTSLSDVCRPSGDWMIRVTYTCTLAGACCDVDGVCQPNIDDTACADQGGTFMGDGTECNEVVCPTPVGACCYQDICLQDVDQSGCENLSSGVYMGNGSDCLPGICDLGACCKPDGACDDRIETECVLENGTWQGGGTDCGNFHCPQPRGACCISDICFPNQARDTCDSVGTFMGIGSACVPDICAAVACPVTTIGGATPPNATVDARQPHAVDQASPREGIGSSTEPIVIQLGVSSAESCFDLCETAPDPLDGDNNILDAVNLGGGAYELSLVRAVTFGAITTIRYLRDGSFVRYVSHPGNVNADASANLDDVSAWVAVFDGSAAPVHGLYSVDLDRSGSLTFLDVLRLADLLNGADSFEPWRDTSLPSATTCP